MAGVSCQDMLDTTSERFIIDPQLNEKTDSMFYTLGMLKGLQMAIDQYVLTGELRGDLTEVNAATENSLRQLASFSTSQSNPYDSAYVYYRVINNCNYYIAHRDTTLSTGSRPVAMQEYAEAKAIRAWAYLQLARNYGSVPFYTSPLMNIADVEEAASMARLDLNGIVSALAPDLERYSGYAVPQYGTFDAGTGNQGEAKSVIASQTMIPVDVILGDMYLETAQYEKAAQHFYTYLYNNKLTTGNLQAPAFNYPDMRNLPSDFTFTTGMDYQSIFTLNNPSDIVTYVPMAVNKMNGTTTRLPAIFGYNFYSTDERSAYVQSQISPSKAYTALSDAQVFYYQPRQTTDAKDVKGIDIGDMRRYSILQSVSLQNGDTATVYNFMTKYANANVSLYRVSAIYLKLAEALNRMDYPDAAFAILKDGLNRNLETDTTYMTARTKAYLSSVLPFLSEANAGIWAENRGIHSRGCGITAGGYTPYSMKETVGLKLAEIASEYGITPGTTRQDTINAVEDLICDEYALELTFEGNRFGDLCRLARHKNASSPAAYGPNFGGRWMARKLAAKTSAIDLSQEANWYLPFK